MKENKQSRAIENNVLSALQEIDSNAVSNFLGSHCSKDQNSDASWSKVLWGACGV